MSLIYTCNFCGETIAADDPYVTLNANGERAADFWRTGWIGHYHADPALGCWSRLLQAVRSCDAPRLDEIPTASHQAITARRRRHKRPDGDEGAAPA